MSRFHLAQLNVAHLRAPLDAPEMADFVAALAPINALAEGAPGFVWRLQGDAGDATGFRPLGEDILVNMSVWTDLQALGDYVYRSGHVDVMRRRREWMHKMSGVTAVLWWIPRGHVPTVDEAVRRLDHLRAHGPTPEAFPFRKPFPAPDAAAPLEPNAGDECPAS